MILPTKINKICLIALTFLFSQLFGAKVSAATLYLNPATGSVDTNFDINVTVDTKDSSNLKSVEAFITYDPTKVAASNIQNGVFDNYSSREVDNAVGLITIKAEMTDPPAANEIVQLAKISFTALKSNENITVDFSKSTQNQSKIVDIIGTNILTSSTGSTLLVNSETNTTTTVTSTTSSSTGIPSTGSFNPVFFITMFIVVVIFSILVRVYALSKL